MHCEGHPGATTLRSYHIMRMANAEPFYVAYFLPLNNVKSARRIPHGFSGWDARKRLNMVNSLRLSRYFPLAKHFA